ncbi:DMT family transporter [Schnuerera sp. xch1]|uniref:DMT family transporter n=1 Tax=Schnuerera sp. xch1 TaxID=2874283 RepID=UPI001CBEA9B1|nr:DMT family transporter [Schnuerera sp. xch1]MBZ2175806.1 DMT family transporter [Schnuerera sp. xch1]
MKVKGSLYADVSLLLVAMIWGSGFVVTKNSLDHITPYFLMTYRFMIAFILMGIVFFKKLKKSTREDWKAGAIIGTFLFIAFATQTVGLNYTTAGKQAFITATNVVMVPFIYWAISKKKPDMYEIVAVFLCIIGVGILSLDDNLDFGYGEFLTFICAIFFALHIASIGYFSNEHDPIILSVIQILVAGILSTMFALLFEPGGAGLNNQSLFSVLYLAVFSTLTAFLIQNVAQKYTTSTHAAIILSFESVFGGLFSIIFLKEVLTIRFLVGCISILIAVLTTETKWKFLRKDISEDTDNVV